MVYSTEHMARPNYLIKGPFASTEIISELWGYFMLYPTNATELAAT